MYHHTVTDLTEYDPFLESSEYNMYNGSNMGHPRRSNSRSGYRLFARVSNSLNRVVAADGTVSGNSRMPCRESVYNFFSQFGNLLDCYLPDSATNVAYLCFEEEETIEAVLALPEHLLCVEGVYVCLSRASPRPDYAMNNTDRVFVKNCPENISRTDLRNYFSQFGLVTDVYIPKDKVTCEQKKFAFVTFATVDCARSAISFGDTHRLIYVDRLTNVLSTAPLQVMPAEARPMSNTNTPTMAPYYHKRSLSTESFFNLGDNAFTTASSTVATNTPTSSMTVEAAASVLINALSQMGNEMLLPSPAISAASQSEIDEIIAKLGNFRLDPVTTPDEDHTSSSSSAPEVNIYEEFLNPSWSSK